MLQTPSIITPQQALSLGWSIIPCNQKKIAMLTSWKPYQTRPPKPEELETWLKLKPPAWAIVTGSLSQRITLDFDGEAGRQTLEAMEIDPHRSTPSGGFHVDFKHPGWRVSSLNSKSKLELGKRWPGMDVRGDGGYALFYGDKYAWLRDPEPYPLAVLPQDLQAFLGIRPVEPSTDEMVRIALDRVPSEGRNSAGFWLATQLRDNGLEQNRALAAMQAYRSMCPSLNRKGEVEEYSEAEAIASLEQAFGRPPRQPWTPLKVNGGIHVIQPPAPAPAAPPNNKRNYQVSNSGVFLVDDETGAKTFVSSWLIVEAMACDQNSESWGRRLKWRDPSDSEHTWVVPMRMLVGDGVSVRETLADGGLEIGTNPKTNHLLSEYIRSAHPRLFVRCTPRVGWFEKSFVFPEHTIPENAPVAYQAQGRGEHFYRKSGTLESWRDQIGRKCRGNSRLLFAASAALAGPLLRPLGVQGGGFHFRSFSSLGKSTAQYVAGSVWGGGGPNGFARTWASTKSATESTAELHNDGCLILDEIRMVEPRDVEQIIYMLANGSGKSRETRTMTGRRTLLWRLMILSSGEITPSETAALAGVKIKGGAEIRMAPIPADAEKDMGLFEELHDTENPRIFAETLEAAAKENYGTAISAFLEHLINHWDEETGPDAKKFLDDFVTHVAENYGPEIQRVARRFAVCALAGEIATTAGITGWEPSDASTAAGTCFYAWLKEHGVDPIDIQNVISQIREIVSSSHDRFYPAEPMTIRDKDGQDKPISQHVHNALGYWKMIDEGMIYLVHADKFKTELCHGYDYREVAKELAKRKLLLLVESGTFTYKSEVTLPSGVTARPRFYAIKATIIETS